MQSVRAIICFNGGSAGDFLKLACNQQLNPGVEYYMSDRGMIEMPHDFKDFTNAVFNKTRSWAEVNTVAVSPVDNTHFYFEEFKSLTKNLFYIDYPNSVNSTVVDLYANKRVQDLGLLVSRVKSTLPVPMQRYVNEHTVKDICQIRWKRNIDGWRSNPDLCAVQLTDFFDFEKLTKIVTQVTGSAITNFSGLRALHTGWTEKNKHVQQIFEQANH